MMRVFRYVAIITKNTVVQGKTSFTTKRGCNAIALDSRAIMGHLLGETPQQGRDKAVERLKQDYPEELGYGNHHAIRVEEVPEIVIE